MIAEFRRQANITQKDLANILGYSSSQFISNFERGRAAVPGSRFKKLVKVLKLKPEDKNELLSSVLEDRMQEIRRRYN